MTSAELAVTNTTEVFAQITTELFHLVFVLEHFQHLLGW